MSILSTSWQLLRLRWRKRWLGECLEGEPVWRNKVVHMFYEFLEITWNFGVFCELEPLFTTFWDFLICFFESWLDDSKLWKNTTKIVERKNSGSDRLGYRLNFCRSAPKASPKIRNSFAQINLRSCFAQRCFPNKNQDTSSFTEPPLLFGYILSAGGNGKYSQKEREGQRWQGRRNKQIDGGHRRSGTASDFKSRTTVQFMVSNDVFLSAMDLPNVFYFEGSKADFVVLDGISIKGIDAPLIMEAKMVFSCFF